MGIAMLEQPLGKEGRKGQQRREEGLQKNTESEPQMSDYETKTEQQRLNASSREGHQHPVSIARKY